MKDKVESSTTTELIHLFVSLPNDDVCSLRDVTPKTLIHPLKSRIELRIGIPGDLIHLFFMNKELADDKTLREYKIKHGCILRVRIHKTWLGLFLTCSKGDTYDVFQNGVQKMRKETEDFDVELWNKLVVKRATFALFMATYHGYLSLMLELLNTSAADINGRTVFGRTCLHIAAFQGFVGCVSLLLSEGALCSELDVFGKTPLQLAHVNRHFYCQKRLYMHQMSNDEGTNGRRSKTAPHEMVKSLEEKRRTKEQKGEKNTLFSGTDAAVFRQTESLPSITIPRGSLFSPHNHTNPLPSYDLPVMKIIEPLKNHHSEDEITSVQTPIIRARTAPAMRDGQETQSSAARGIRGIEAIHRTSQNDIVGEYHNIAESIADINATTIRLSLPKEEKLPSNASDQINILIETRVQSPPNNKLLGFVLKAEEKRTVNQERQTSSDSSLQDDKLETPDIVGNLVEEKQLSTVDTSSNPTIKQDMWMPAINGSSETDHQDDRMWTPVAYDSILKNSKPAHRKIGPSLSYDAWLEKKKSESKVERPSSATNLRSKVGRELDVAAFQKWLEGKKKFRKRSKSEATIEHHRSSSGVAFEVWLDQKRQQMQGGNARSTLETPEKCEPRPKAANLSGKSFSEWLAEKRKKHQGEDSKTVNKQNRSHSGKTYGEWLRDKRKEKQKEASRKENMSILELEKKALVEQRRRLNPRVKTFLEWFEEKRAQSVIEIIQTKNTPDESRLLNSKKKFAEDACLVFDMWLMAKNMEELKKEERMYEEMVEKWRRKEAERLQERRSILNRLGQAKNDK